MAGRLGFNLLPRRRWSNPTGLDKDLVLGTSENGPSRMPISTKQLPRDGELPEGTRAVLISSRRRARLRGVERTCRNWAVAAVSFGVLRVACGRSETPNARGAFTLVPAKMARCLVRFTQANNFALPRIEGCTIRKNVMATVYFDHKLPDRAIRRFFSLALPSPIKVKDDRLG